LRYFGSAVNLGMGLPLQEGQIGLSDLITQASKQPVPGNTALMTGLPPIALVVIIPLDNNNILLGQMDGNPGQKPNNLSQAKRRGLGIMVSQPLILLSHLPDDITQYSTIDIALLAGAAPLIIIEI